MPFEVGGYRVFSFAFRCSTIYRLFNRLTGCSVHSHYIIITIFFLFFFRRRERERKFSSNDWISRKKIMFDLIKELN